MNDFIANYWTVLIAGATLFLTVIFDIISQLKNMKDNEPQLSFELKNIEGMLFLKIKNTGQTKATNIKINIEKIRNNGNNNLEESFIFTVPFELNSMESTQGMIAIYNGNIARQVFPYIDINISYNKSHFKKRVNDKRQVFFNPDVENNVLSDIKEEIHSLNKEIDNLRKPILRLANYFDGYQIAPFDEINLLANKNFQEDIYNAVIEKKKGNCTSREDSIKMRFR